MNPLEWIGSLPTAEALRGSSMVYIVVSAAHILGIGLLVGAILPLDLRLVGLLRSGPLTVLAPFLSRVAATGLAIAILTGFLLFSVKPADYAGNPAFLAKMGLLALGLANVAAQHVGSTWRRTLDTGYVTRLQRALAALSLATWLAALVAGRWIGFV